MEFYLKKTKQIVGVFQEVKIKHIARTENYRTDMLARMAATADPKLSKLVLVEVKTSPSIGQ